MKILLKISGEALQWTHSHGVDPLFLKELSLDLSEILKKWHSLAIVLGWGNIFRGMSGVAEGMNRVAADYMWILATIMNGIALQDALEANDCQTRLMSALDIPEVAEKYINRRWIRHMEKGRIVICVAGTGNPYFTTDTAWVLRALELGCDMMIKATKVDGVYDKDPSKYPDAKLLEYATYDEVIKTDIRVMDQTAVALARDGELLLKVVNLNKKWAFLRAIDGEKEGTTISAQKK